MTLEILAVLTLLAVAIVLFATDRVRMDLVALIVLAGLGLTGLVTPAEALSGFSSPAVVTVWAILILSGALARTGVAALLGRHLVALAGESEVRLLVILMLTAGVLSGFMNSIGVAALFLPVVIEIAHRKKRPASKLLMPLAFAALLGGLTTLIGTPPNILISEALQEAGLRPFRMFDFTPMGIVLLLAGTAYMALVGRHLLPDRDITREFKADRTAAFTSLYELQERMVILQVPAGSILHGKTLAESRLGSVLGLNTVAVIRNGRTQLAPDPGFPLQSGDRLLVEGRLDRLLELHHQDLFEVTAGEVSPEQLDTDTVEILEARLPPGSSLIGHSLRQTGFRHKYAAIVLAIRRGDVILRTNLEGLTLLTEDVLLLQLERRHRESLLSDSNLEISRPDSLHGYNLEERLMIVAVPPDSPLVGKSLIDSRLGDSFGLGVLGIVRDGETQLMPDPQEVLRGGDRLLVKGKRADLGVVAGLQSLEIDTRVPSDLGEIESEEIGLVEAVLSPHTTLAGKTLRDLNFRAKFGLSALAVWREGRAYRSGLRDIQLRFGDALLLYGPRTRLRMLGSEPDFLVLAEEAQEAPRIEKAPWALAIMGLVLLPVIFGWLPIAITAVAGVVLMVLTGCLTMEEAYRHIEWKAIFLIAGMLPLGIAMQASGAATFLADGVVASLGGLGPLAIAAGLFILAALASQVMPNPAVAVLLAPIALSAAVDLGISPYPLLMVVAVSASAAFLSPVGHSANVLVMGPGGYRFSDYLRVGAPLTLVVLLVVLLTLPILWPF